jgi:NAD(P)-dependent dehydrogenase (short-subunit alcohol dehydrogenase family)
MTTPTIDLSGRNIVITGANTGIGRISAIELARAGANVTLACRSREKTEPVLAEIKAATGRDAAFVALDLGSLASVRTAVSQLLQRGEPIHVLLNNAGLGGQRGATADGFELAFGTNHVGHFALTHGLLDRIRSSPHARIVNVASKMHYRCNGIDFDAVRKPTRTLTGAREYGVSKLANVLFTQRLQRELAGTSTVAVSLHPGVVKTDVWRGIPWPIRNLVTRGMITPEQGAQTSIYCCSAPEVAASPALYYDRSKPREAAALAKDRALADELWTRSLEYIGAAR